MFFIPDMKKLSKKQIISEMLASKPKIKGDYDKDNGYMIKSVVEDIKELKNVKPEFTPVRIPVWTKKVKCMY